MKKRKIEISELKNDKITHSERIMLENIEHDKFKEFKFMLGVSILILFLVLLYLVIFFEKNTNWLYALKDDILNSNLANKSNELMELCGGFVFLICGPILMGKVSLKSIRDYLKMRDEGGRTYKAQYGYISNIYASKCKTVDVEFTKDNTSLENIPYLHRIMDAKVGDKVLVYSFSDNKALALDIKKIDAKEIHRSF